MEAGTLGITIAVVSLMVSIVTSGMVNWRAVEGQARDTVARLVSRETVHARTVVRRAAHSRVLSGERQRDFEEAVLLLLGVIQSVELHARFIKGANVITTEATVIYRLLDEIVDDLTAALDKFGTKIDWRSAGIAANRVLDAMPRVRNGWSRTVATPPSARLPVSVTAAGDLADDGISV